MQILLCHSVMAEFLLLHHLTCNEKAYIIQILLRFLLGFFTSCLKFWCSYDYHNVI